MPKVTQEHVDARRRRLLSAAWSASSSATLNSTPPSASASKVGKVSVPVAFTSFPGEIFRAPRSWVEKIYPSLVYFNELDRGGHFAAWEEPELFTSELRAAFRTLR